VCQLHEKNDEMLNTGNGERNILHTINRGKANWIGHIRNYLLKHVIDGKIEGRIEVTGRRGRRREQLLDDVKEKRVLEIERGSARSRFV